MKRASCIILFLVCILAGCKQTSDPADAPTTNNETIQSISLTSLNLAPNQTFGVFDYYEDQALLLIHDTEKRLPSEKDLDEGPAKYCYKFVLYDIKEQKIAAEFPIEQFGHCLSAIYAYDGVLFIWVTSGGDMVSSINYLNQQGTNKVCDLHITKFSDALLCHTDGGAIFSYTTEFKDGEFVNGEFGVKRITSDLSVEPVLTFNPEQTDFISDDLVTCQDRTIYTVGEQEQVTCYVGTANKEHIKFSLPKDDKIFSCCVTADWVIVSKLRAPNDGGGYFLERFDLEGNSIELYQLERPLYILVGTDTNKFGGLNYGSYVTEPIGLFEITDSIHPIEIDSNIFDETPHGILSNDQNFLVPHYSYGGGDPKIWLIRP